MGFTRYWERTDVPIGNNFIAEVNSILIDCAKKGIAIRNWNGENRPEISKDRIALNGNENCGLDHESFVIDDKKGFNFCKTARKPYDYAVREILKVAEKYCLVFNVSCDYPSNEGIYSDEEYLLGLNDRSNWW